MGTVLQHPPALFLAAVFSRDLAALEWAKKRIEEVWGPTLPNPPIYRFDETDYYQASMGSDLHKTFFVSERCHPPEDLPDWKHRTNRWEQEYRCDIPDVARPLNIDPGYLTSAKLVLASTKDHAHRLYLRNGIYAELTLQYRRGSWHRLPWTYPNYQRADYHQFFSRCRDHVRQTIRVAASGDRDTT